MPAQKVTIPGFKININPIPVPPLSPNPATGSQLPDGEVGQPVTADNLVTITGGTPPYSASPINGTIPAGMSIGQSVNQVTGAVAFYLHGTPTTAESDTFDLQVTDSTP